MLSKLKEQVVRVAVDLKKSQEPRKKVSPSGKVFRSKRDYDRNRIKRDLKKEPRE